MESIKKCRICMANVIPLRSIVNTHLQEMYELLTMTPLETKDSRPTQVCYICCARLQNCYQLKSSCIQSEQLFTQILDNNVFAPAEKESLCKNSFTIAHPVVQLSMGDELESSDSDDSETWEVFGQKTVKEENGQEEENSDSDENSIDLTMQFINTSDPLDIVKNELDDDSTSTPVLKKPRMVLQRNLGDITKSIENTFDTSTEKIEQTEIDMEIAVRQKAVAGSMPTNEKIDHDKSTFSESSRTSDHNDTQIEKSVINIRIGASVSNTSRKSLNTHRCDICQKSFSNNHLLNMHIRAHTHEKPFKCKLCEKSFNRKNCLSKHTRTHTGEKPFKCKLCEKCFGQMSHLNRHILTHSGEKPFQCKLCEKCFTDKSCLNKHIRIHTGEKPFKCKFCEKCFCQKSQLNGHIRTHTGEKPFKCKFCEKCFSHMSQLNSHIRTHTGEKPFKCKFCEKCFCQISHLNNHISTHTGKKPFKCKLCEKCFIQKVALNKHIRTHTGEKPFKCKFCEKCFCEMSHLNRHIRTHSGEKLFQCKLCDKCYTENGSLKKHIRTHAGQKV